MRKRNRNVAPTYESPRQQPPAYGQDLRSLSYCRTSLFSTARVSPLLSLPEVVRTPRRATHLHVSFPVRQAFPEAPHSQVQANWPRVPLYHPRFHFHIAPGTSSWRPRHSTTWHIPLQLQHPDLCLPLLHRRGIRTMRATCLVTYPDPQNF
jgi:hypothetical protein